MWDDMERCSSADRRRKMSKYSLVIVKLHLIFVMSKLYTQYTGFVKDQFPTVANA